jgi:thioredoxin 1
MRHRALHYLTLLAVASVFGSCPLCATAWKLVLKNGKAIECDGVPIVVNDVYLFRNTDGKDSTLSADQVDREKTDRANQVVPAPRQWRIIGESVRDQSPAAAARTASEGVLTLSDADFDTEVLNSKTPVLVDFWATWCGYCRRIEPTVNAIAGEYAGRLKVGKVDIDKNRATTTRYGITATPTLLLFKQGRVVGIIKGAAEKPAVIRMLQPRL